MKPIPARLWAYVRPYGWALGASLALVVVVGALEAFSQILIGLIFDRLLGASSASVVSIPPIIRQLSAGISDGRVFLALLITATVIKTTAEYGSINTISYLGQAVVRDMRN